MRNQRKSTYLQFLWVLSTMFITMAFVGNLKSTLVRKSYEARTMTLNEMIDKEMPVHIPNTKAGYLEMDQSNSILNKRILCQAKRTNGVFVVGYACTIQYFIIR